MRNAGKSDRNWKAKFVFVRRADRGPIPVPTTWQVYDGPTGMPRAQVLSREEYGLSCSLTDRIKAEPERFSEERLLSL